MHSDYHRPSDDADKINRQGLREVCRYLLASLVKVANEDRLPKFREEVRRESESGRRRMEEPLPKASLASWPKGQPPPRLGISCARTMLSLARYLSSSGRWHSRRNGRI